LLKKLDQEVGAGKYTVFLTADHAVADVPQYLVDNKVPGGYFNGSDAREKLETFLQQYYPNRTFIEASSSGQIYLKQDAFGEDTKTSGLDLLLVSELIGKFLMTVDGVADYYTESTLRQASFNEEGIRGAVVRGFNPKRSGDIVVVFQPGWFEGGSPTGTTHGSPYNYDTHVPALFYGGGIKKGKSVRYHTITDIAPTISTILNIKFPNGCTGQPVAEIFE
jgi:arylsulfatase A-like enzyme